MMISLFLRPPGRPKSEPSHAEWASAAHYWAYAYEASKTSCGKRIAP